MPVSVQQDCQFFANGGLGTLGLEWSTAVELLASLPVSDKNAIWNFENVSFFGDPD